jgi:hypothetical protein
MQLLLSQGLTLSVERVVAPGRACTHPGMDVYWYERDTPLGITAFLGMTIVLQLMAAVLALQLIRITAQRTAWVLLALALVLRALQRGLFFLWATVGEAPLPPLMSAILGLGIAVCLVVGIWLALHAQRLNPEIFELRENLHPCYTRETEKTLPRTRSQLQSSRSRMARCSPPHRHSQLWSFPGIWQRDITTSPQTAHLSRACSEFETSSLINRTATAVSARSHCPPGQSVHPQ